MLKVLGSPNSWEIISTAFASEKKPVDNPAHTKWMQHNSHSHPHQELLLILRGQGYQGFQGNVYTYAPNTVFLFDSFEEHDFYYPKWTSETDQLWLGCFQNHIVYSLIHIEDGKPEYFGHTVLSKANTGSWVQSLNAPNNLPSALKKLHVFSSVSSLVSLVLQFSFTKPTTARETISFQEQIVLAIQEHIQQTSGNGISLDNLAHLSGYSKFHFERIFKQHTGLSIHQYIDECRRTKAECMLKEGCLKKDIAQALGFSAHSAYSRWYKQKSK